MDKRKNGAYYTPKKLAEYISEYILQELNIEEQIKILEPSCGDGIFIKEILKKRKKNIEIIGIEKNEEEAKKSKKIVANYGKVLNKNYLEYHFEEETKFDLIIGNPPYVNLQLMSKEDLDLSRKIIEAKKIKKIKYNLWIPFIISAIDKIKDNGIVVFILPAEFLSISSSKEVRDLLDKEFETIEIINFNEVIFQGIEQDTIVFCGYKKKKKYAYSYFLFQNIDALIQGNILVKTNYKSKLEMEKWSSIFLKNHDLIFLEQIKSKMNLLKDFIESSPGVVTGNNDFFIVSKEIIEQYNLEKYAKIILKKSSLIKMPFQLFQDELILKGNKGEKIYLLDFNKNNDFNEIKEYVSLGEELKVNQGYKCRTRKEWYKIPNVATGEELIFFKRNHLYPKLVINNDRVLTTDTAYKIKIKEPYDKKSIFLSFYNILNFIFSEISGRYYSGGVLELIPSEFKNLPFIYLKYTEEEYEILSEAIKLRGIDVLLEYNNNKILKDKLGLNNEEINRLYRIWKLLQNRRMKNKEDKL